LIKDFVRSGGEEFFNWIDGDVIGIDQRGTGLSIPNLKTDVLYDLPLTDPGDRAEYLKRIKAACLQVASQFRAREIDLSGYNTAESADDVDAVRAAIGYEKAILWGRSYGSHLALATLKRHESHIEKVVLCSPEGPDHTFKLPIAADETIGRLGELVGADPQLGKVIPDLRLLVKEVLDGLQRQPVRVQTINPITQQPSAVGISKFDIQHLTAQALGMEQQMRSLPRAYFKMSRGEFDDMAKVLIVMRSRAGVESAMKQMMDCSSGASPQRLARIREQANQSLLGDTINFPYPDIAEAWGNPDLGPAYRAPIQSMVPILLICGDLDARTPVANARELMAGLPAAQLIVAENGGHDLNMFGTPALRSLIAEFLHDQKISSEHITLPALKFLPIN
jgi:pimeloyl-ACP methyl ester carboxylesterase